MNRKQKGMPTALGAFVLFAMVLSASAEPVSREMSQRVAQAFLLKEQAAPPRVAMKAKGEFVVRDHAVGLTLGRIHSITDENGLVLAYVQELEPKGFIITSADDAVKPVLGFSFSGKWEVDVGNRNPLVDLVTMDVEYRKRLLLEAKETQTEGIMQVNKDEWVAELDYARSTQKQAYCQIESSTEWGPWLQTEWDQAGHWNNKCPYTVAYVPGIRRPTGCVATAMAQIINYWKYPASVDFSDNEFISISGTHHSFDDSSVWGFPSLSELRTSMSSLLYNGDDEEEAYLSFAAGVKLHMNYGVLQSGANTYSVRDVLNSHFGFGSAIADTDADGVWFSHRTEIIEDIMNGYPVQIAIHQSGRTGGHSVVVDGYRENDNSYFWVNMGWGGSSNAWYNIPDIRSYDVVHTVVYGIARYQGWNQIGADQRNSYHAVYPAPINEPVRKWLVSVPSGLPTSYRYGHLIIGTGGRMYASLNPNILGDNYHPYIAIFDKFGTRENLIEVPQSNTAIAYLCQNSRGEVFFGSDQGGPTATNSKLFRLNPNTDQIMDILTHSSPDTGIFEQPIKVDRDDYLYFIITPRQTANYAKFYAVSRTGTYKWAPYSFPSAAEFHRTIPAIDEDRDRVYLNYFEKTEQYKGRSRLIAFKRSDGTQIFDVILPNIPTHYASAMAGAPAIGEDGTVYVGAYTSLYAYSSNGTKLWEKSFDPAYSYRTPAIGNDGTLYVNYGKLVSGNWRPGYVRALDQANGNTKWEMALSLGENDHMGEIYAAANGIVVYSYDKNGVYRLGGAKDNGTTYGSTWDMEGGGTLAFGPGRTIFSVPPGHDQSIWALSDSGERGDPEGLGMDFADNGQPFSPSSPSPVDGAVDQPTASVQLSWTCSDPDAHSLRYDVFACALVEDEEAAFVPVATQLTENSYTLTGLQQGTQYLWTVVATDGQAMAEGPVWSFVTGGAQPISTPTPTPTATDTPPPSPTPPPSVSPTPSASPTGSPTHTPTPTSTFPPGTVVYTSIDGGDACLANSDVRIGIRVAQNTVDEVGAYGFLVTYDSAAVAFVSAEDGGDGFNSSPQTSTVGVNPGSQIRVFASSGGSTLRNGRLVLLTFHTATGGTLAPYSITVGEDPSFPDGLEGANTFERIDHGLHNAATNPVSCGIAPTGTPVPSPTVLPTLTPSPTVSPIPSPSSSPTAVPTASPTATISTPTQTPTPTATSHQPRFDFGDSSEGWTFHSSPPFTPPISAQIAGNPGVLSIQARNSTNTFGYWESPVFDLASPTDGESSFYTAAYRVMSSVSVPAQVPQLRLRTTAANLQQSTFLVVDSCGDGAFSPTPSGNTYRLPFIPAPGASRFMLEFDMLNFNPADAPNGDLLLDSVEVAYHDESTLSAVTVHRTYTFDTSNEGWTYHAAPTFSAPTFGTEPGALIITGIADRTDVFGYWGSPEADVLIDPTRIYLVTFEVESDVPSAERTLVPQFRVRVNEQSYHGAMYVAVESRGTSLRSPVAGEPQEYTVIFIPPPTTAGQGLIQSFDFLNFDATDKANATLKLKTVTVGSIANFFLQ